MGIVVGCASILISCVISVRRNPYFWYDELATSSLVSDSSLGHMLRAVARGAESNPPLFTLVMHGWAAIAGNSALSLRLANALFICGAFAVAWITMRRVYSTGDVALGMCATFFGAQALLEQIAQARFYGLFLLAATVAFALAFIAMRSPVINTRLLVATFAAHTVLVYTHMLGSFFSGAIFAAIVVSDFRARRRRLPLYLAIIGAWLLFMLWLPAVRVQSDIGKPRNWMVLPQRSDFIALIARQTVWLPLVLAFSVFVEALLRRRAAAPVARDMAEGEGDHERMTLLILAVAFIAIVPFIFVFSRVAVPVFLDRYLLPAILGWAVIVAHACRSIRTPHLAAGPGDRKRGILRAMLYAGLALYPIGYAFSLPRASRPAVSVGAGLDSLPVVVEAGHDFWPLEHYSGGPGNRYRFLLDWPLALDSANFPGAVQEYKLLSLYKREGYIGTAVEDGATFLCSEPRFLVVDRPEFKLFEKRVASDSAFTWSTVGDYQDAKVRLVTRRHAGCAATMTNPGPARARAL